MSPSGFGGGFWSRSTRLKRKKRQNTRSLHIENRKTDRAHQVGWGGGGGDARFPTHLGQILVPTGLSVSTDHVSEMSFDVFFGHCG